MNKRILRRVIFTLGLICSLFWFEASLTAQQPGGIRAWGLNSSGQLGDGTLASSSYPVESWYAFPVTGIAAGGYHSLAVKTGGTVLAWGDNSTGNLGNGTFVSSPNVAPVPGLTGVVAVAANGHSLALKSNGTIAAWGDNSSGQLGDGTRISRNTPEQVPNLSGITAIAAGDAHSLALQSYPCVVLNPGSSLTAGARAVPGGTTAFATCTRVLAWGDNSSGQLGNGSHSNSNTAVVVSGLTGVVAIAAGHLHSLALRSDGTVWAWGYNEYGQLGNGTNIDSNVPVQVAGLTGVTAISAGAIHSVALKSDGTVAGWGSNGLGQLGNGSYNDSNVPVIAWLFPPVAAVAAGPVYTVALKADGTGWAWGWNHYGQLGNSGAGETSNTPVQVLSLTGATRISAGGGHVLALNDPFDSFSPSSLNFGNVAPGGSATQVVTLKNLGPDALFLNSISIGGANPGDFKFSFPFLPASITLNTSVPIVVTFTPTASGARSATLVFDDYSFGGPHTVNLSGSSNVTADLGVSQTVAVSGRQLTYTINVRNNGPGPVSDATIRDPLPAQTQLVSLTGPGCSRGISGSTTCKPIGLASGAQATFTAILYVTTTLPIQITNVVSVSATAPDPNSKNNTSRLVTNWPGLPKQP